MKKTLFIALTTLSLATAAGCKKKGGGGEALAKLQETADKVCAAKDLAAATAAQEEFAKWSTEWAKNNPAGDKAAAPSEADTKAFADATKKLTDCYTKLASAGAATPPATPPAAGSADPAAAPAAPADPAAGSAAPAAGSADPAAAGSAK